MLRRLDFLRFCLADGKSLDYLFVLTLDNFFYIVGSTFSFLGEM